MIAALGISGNPFDPFDPGRLCRGRERWIDPWDGEVPHPTLFRAVISGAAFDDDSARDARRGVPFSRVSLAKLVSALFPGAPLVAFMEDGHPADIPDGAEGVEAYSGHRAGGRAHDAMVRWHLALPDAASLAAFLGRPSAETDAAAMAYDLPQPYGPDLLASERVRGFAVTDGADAELLERLFLLVGMSTLDSPPARFQPAALPDVLARIPAVVLLHRDKHGPAVGVYVREPADFLARVSPLCSEAGALLVPFAIPPMLARWDRALSDLRRGWNEATQGPFPVPASPNPAPWERRRRRGRRDEPMPGLDEVAFEEAPVATELPPDDAPVAPAATEDDGPDDDTDDAPDEGDDDEGDTGDGDDDEGADDEDAGDDASDEADAGSDDGPDER